MAILLLFSPRNAVVSLLPSIYICPVCNSIVRPVPTKTQNKIRYPNPFEVIEGNNSNFECIIVLNMNVFFVLLYCIVCVLIVTFENRKAVYNEQNRTKKKRNRK